jgi:hypothetical protein
LRREFDFIPLEAVVGKESLRMKTSFIKMQKEEGDM